jgi:hypothetical protein
MDVWVSIDNPWGEPHGIRPYHREGCPYMTMPGMDPAYWQPMPKATAQAQEREPCTRCKP